MKYTIISFKCSKYFVRNYLYTSTLPLAGKNCSFHGNIIHYEMYSISNYGISHVDERNGFVICPVMLRYIIKFGLIFRQLTVSKTFSICTYLFPVCIIASLYVYYFAINHANTILGKPYL